MPPDCRYFAAGRAGGPAGCSRGFLWKAEGRADLPPSTAWVHSRSPEPLELGSRSVRGTMQAGIRLQGAAFAVLDVPCGLARGLRRGQRVQSGVARSRGFHALAPGALPNRAIVSTMRRPSEPTGGAARPHAAPREHLPRQRLIRRRRLDPSIRGSVDGRPMVDPLPGDVRTPESDR